MNRNEELNELQQQLDAAVSKFKEADAAYNAALTKAEELEKSALKAKAAKEALDTAIKEDQTAANERQAKLNSASDALKAAEAKVKTANDALTAAADDAARATAQKDIDDATAELKNASDLVKQIEAETQNAANTSKEIDQKAKNAETTLATEALAYNEAYAAYKKAQNDKNVANEAVETAKQALAAAQAKLNADSAAPILPADNLTGSTSAPASPAGTKVDAPAHVPTTHVIEVIDQKDDVKKAKEKTWSATAGAWAKSGLDFVVSLVNPGASRVVGAAATGAAFAGLRYAPRVLPYVTTYLSPYWNRGLSIAAARLMPVRALLAVFPATLAALVPAFALSQLAITLLFATLAGAAVEYAYESFVNKAHPANHQSLASLVLKHAAISVLSLVGFNLGTEIALITGLGSTLTTVAASVAGLVSAFVTSRVVDGVAMHYTRSGLESERRYSFDSKGYVVHDAAIDLDVKVPEGSKVAHKNESIWTALYNGVTNGFTTVKGFFSKEKNPLEKDATKGNLDANGAQLDPTNPEHKAALANLANGQNAKPAPTPKGQGLSNAR